MLGQNGRSGQANGYCDNLAGAMTVRTKAQLRTLITDSLETDGENTAAELRAVLTDIVDSLELAPTAPTGAFSYVGWASPAAANAQPAITAADFAAATSYQGDSVTVPAQITAGDYLWFARDVYPSHVRFNSAQGRDAINDFDEQTGAGHV